MKVQKNSGKIEEFDARKIRVVIDKAFRGIKKITPIELESSIQSHFYSGIKTRDIQKILVMTAISKVDPQTPEWLLVAGRLAMRNLNNEIRKKTKFDYEDYEKFLDKMIKTKKYKNFKKFYTQDEIHEAQKQINRNKDDKLVISQVMSLRTKYLLKSAGKIIEYPQFADLSNSLILAKKEPQKMFWQKEFFRNLVDEEISLATPFKSNLRVFGGNVGSCFILPTPDSLLGITKGWADMASISKEGGGIGVYLGSIRPGDSFSENIPKANIITKWVKIINDIAVSVNQRGIRKGAITPAIDWWHLDVFEFIEVKSETSGELRDKCFDIFPQVVVDKYFIDKVKSDGDVYLVDSYELKKHGIDLVNLIDEDLYSAHKQIEKLVEEKKIKHFTKIKAKTLWKKCLTIWFETGDFYIAHKDNINISNYLKGYSIDNEPLLAHSVNLCIESFSVTKTPTKYSLEVDNDQIVKAESNGMYHSCNLISINVGVIHSDKDLERVCRSAVRMLDNSIDEGEMPVIEAKNSSEALRNVGIGTVGVADWMAYNKLSYEKDEDILELEKLQEKIAWYCYNASIELAKERGSYTLFEHANYDSMFGKPVQKLNEISPNKFDWVGLSNRIKKDGIRNFYLLATAPNTSTGLLMNATASFLPPHSKMNYQTLIEDSIPVVPRYLDSRYWYYKGKFQYDAAKLIKVTRSLQRWIDTGISMEVPINPGLTNMKKISDEIIEGFINGECKGVYYSLSVDEEKVGCTDCKN